MFKSLQQIVIRITGCRRILSLCLSAVACCTHAEVRANTTAEAAIIIVNRNDPDSIAIGKYYARKRGIPESKIVQLDAPLNETIRPAEYIERIANPLLNVLLENNWVKGIKSDSKDRYGRERLLVSIHQISFVILIRGIPLRIEHDPEFLDTDMVKIPEYFRVTNASVDGELALLLGRSDLPMTGFIKNPHFNKKIIPAIEANRVLRIARLDGPDKRDVVRLIDRTIEAENVGLMGRAYIDLGGPHARGDKLLRDSGALIKAAHFDTEFETTSRLMDYRDRLDAPAIYMGWYRHSPYAQWRAPKWSVPVGAIAYHIHSYSGTSVRSRSKWLGAFIAQGYCATMGNVYEPYLDFAHYPDILLEHLFKGNSFGDAIMLSTPVLSWQTVAIGDPFYKPFNVSLEDQLKSSTGTPFSSYACIREANRLLKEKGSQAAIAYLKTCLMTKPSLALTYKLAQLYAQENQDGKGLEILQPIRHLSFFPDEEIVLVQKIANYLHEGEESQLAFDLYSDLLNKQNLNKNLRISLLAGGVPIATDVGKHITALRWKTEVDKLKNRGKSKTEQ